jgi:hypothetical protein
MGIWRIPGTLNYPTRKKLARGCSPEPQPVKVLLPWTGELVTPEMVRAAVAAHIPKNDAQSNSGASDDGDWLFNFRFLPAATRKLITSPALPGQEGAARAAEPARRPTILNHRRACRKVMAAFSQHSQSHVQLGK